MSTYSTSAARYRAAGWWPIPVHGKTIPAAGATGYKGTVTDEKIAEWISRNPSVWVEHEDKTKSLEVATNITLRHQLTVAIDVDEYGVVKVDGREITKNGIDELAEFARGRGLSPLPATWSSTARGPETGSRQYLYRIEEDIQFKTKPCPAVELCCWHHRHTVVAPTVHPGVGAPYAWYRPGEPGVPPTWEQAADVLPSPEELPFLPADWLEAFRSRAEALDEDAAVVGLDELLATFPEGEPDGLVRYLIRKWSDPKQHVGHDEVKNHGINILMLGREGHPGVPALWRVFIGRYADYLRSARPNEYERDLHGSDGIVATAVRIAQQKQVTATVSSLIPLMAESSTAPMVDLPANAATTDELIHFAKTYTGFRRPDRLGRRSAWMKAGTPADLVYHAVCLVQDVLAGHYPARAAYKALSAAYLHHGGTDPSGAVSLLSVALGAALDAPRKAAS